MSKDEALVYQSRMEVVVEMSRKIATWSLGIVCLMVVLGLAYPASAGFVEDSIVLRSTAAPTDTSSSPDTLMISLDVERDSSYNIYVLHLHNEYSISDSSQILISKFNSDGTINKIITVANAFPNSWARTNTSRVKADLAVNKTSGALYVAVSSGETVVLYYDTDAPNESGTDDFDSTEIFAGRAAFLNQTDTVGFVAVSVFGETNAQDSVFVIAPYDSRPGLSSTTSASGDTNGIDTPGIKLYRFSHFGQLTDSYLVYLATNGSTDALNGRTSLSDRNIARKIQMASIAPNAVGLLIHGRIRTDTFLNSLPAADIRLYGDTIVDTGLFYDTFSVQGNGVLDSIAGVNVILRPSGDTNIVDAFASMFWNNSSGQVVIYYRDRQRTSSIRRAFISGVYGYIAANDADVGNMSLRAADSDLVAVAAVVDIYGKEHVAVRTNGGKILYFKRDQGNSASNQLDLDTVVLANNLDTISATNGVATTGSVDSYTLGLAVTKDGAPRVFFVRSTQGERYIISAKQQGISVSASDSNLIIVSSQTATTASNGEVTVTAAIATNDSVAAMTQVVVSAATSNNVPANTITTDFSSPSYTVTVPLGNSTGDTVVCLINSVVDGVSVYMRKLTDTDPSGEAGTAGAGIGGVPLPAGASRLDTSVFGSAMYGDTVFEVLAGSFLKLRFGDTGGTVYNTDQGATFAESLAVRVKFQLTEKYLRSLNEVGIDTKTLTVWALRNGKQFEQIGHVSRYTTTQLNQLGAGQLQFVEIIGATQTQFAVDGMGNEVGGSGGSTGGGVCVVTRTFGQSSPVSIAIRQIRDVVLGSKLGRVLASIYYSLN